MLFRGLAHNVSILLNRCLFDVSMIGVILEILDDDCIAT